MNRTNLSIRTVLLLLTLFCLSLLNSCSSHRQFSPEKIFWVDADDKDIPEPEYRDPLLAWQSVDRTVFVQWEQIADVERNFRKIFNSPQQAWNTNGFDEVPDCSWFTNRHGLKRMTVEEITRGVGEGDGPDTSGTWTVFRPKVQGATVGFWIEDSRGDRYIIKFDPHGYPELATSAAAMASRYFHACGYNVPEETIVYWRPENLKIKEGATIKENNRKRSFTQVDLDNILSKVHRGPDGRIRSLASKIIEGKIKGPFSYDGRRGDDPNDWCLHEHRRELRALYVIASLVNHYDTKDQNSLDSYVEKDSRRYLKHFLIDFGSTFGSDGRGSKPPKKGYANIFDLRDVFVSLVTVGIKTWSWQYAKPVEYPSIGYFESEIFEPDKFDPILPNPAFENMTNRDAYWGAKIVMAFRDEDLRALINAGNLSNPKAEEYLLSTLIERRDKIGRHWFSKINPLDHFKFEDSNEILSIGFDDLLVLYGLEDAAVSHYRYCITRRGKDIVENRSIRDTKIELLESDRDLMIAACQKPSDFETNHYELEIRTQRGSGNWSKATRLWLWYHPDRNNFQLVGIEHLD